jgi:hypothetical protein
MNTLNDGFEKYCPYGVLRTYSPYNSYQRFLKLPKSSLITESNPIIKDVPLPTKSIDTAEPEERQPEERQPEEVLGSGISRKGVHKKIGSGVKKSKKGSYSSKYLQWGL